MMCQQEIDRICTETLAGKFGPALIAPRTLNEFLRPSASADVSANLRTAAVWTNARGGNEQGKL